jgi:hypothetical protein
MVLVPAWPKALTVIRKRQITTPCNRIDHPSSTSFSKWLSRAGLVEDYILFSASLSTRMAGACACQSAARPRQQSLPELFDLRNLFVPKRWATAVYQLQ